MYNDFCGDYRKDMYQKKKSFSISESIYFIGYNIENITQFKLFNNHFPSLINN